MNRFVALLRGINVGGKNIIKMEDLRKTFEDMGFQNVSTYIQSGNVLFSSEESNEPLLETKIQKKLSKTFSYDSLVVICSENELKDIIKKAPKGFGKEPDKYKYDVIFLKRPHSGDHAVDHIEKKEGVDQVASGGNVLYFSRLTAELTKSKLSKIIYSPFYKQMTIRNWNTTTKLLDKISD